MRGNRGTRNIRNTSTSGAGEQRAGLLARGPMETPIYVRPMDAPVDVRPCASPGAKRARLLAGRPVGTPSGLGPIGTRLAGFKSLHVARLGDKPRDSATYRQPRRRATYRQTLGPPARDHRVTRADVAQQLRTVGPARLISNEKAAT